MNGLSFADLAILWLDMIRNSAEQPLQFPEGKQGKYEDQGREDNFSQ
jgi:hypothetical protein